MNDNETKGFLHKGHRFPVTRRELLAHGFIGFSGMLALPTLIGLSARKAIAAGCASGGGAATALPFMAFDMAGGASLPGNFLALGPKDLLKDYNLLGWNPREAGALNSDFGVPMSAKHSKLLEGLLASASAEARKNLRMGAICHAAADDTSSNRMNAASLILKASQPGQYIGNGLGTIKSNSGGNSDTALNDVALKPAYIQDIVDLSTATKFGGAAYASLSPKQLKAMADNAVRLGAIQAEELKGFTGGDVLEDLSKCAYQKSLEFLNGVAGLDPRAEAQVAQVYAINAQTNSKDGNAVAAAIAMNAIKGFSGPGVWTLGGCDYHDGKHEVGDAKDREMGVQIGRAVETAHRLKRPFFFQLLTDGGCSAVPGSRNWSGDSGDKCMTIVGCYKPTGAPEMVRTQVGSYTPGQGADKSTLIGSSPTLVAYAVLANYLACVGMIDRFPEFAPGIFAGKGELDSVLFFKNAVA